MDWLRFKVGTRDQLRPVEVHSSAAEAQERYLQSLRDLSATADRATGQAQQTLASLVAYMERADASRR